MLSTSLSQDLYRRWIRPGATDRQVLRVARLAAVGGGILGVLLALVAQTIIGTLSFFYSVLAVTLFVPIVGGLFTGRLGQREALAAVGGGILTMLALQLGVADGRPGWLTPALGGLVMSVIAAAIMLRMTLTRTPAPR
jgi:SSS family solute:Na+ symporter